MVINGLSSIIHNRETGNDLNVSQRGLKKDRKMSVTLQLSLKSIDANVTIY